MANIHLTEKEIKEEIYKVFPNLKSSPNSKEEQKIMSKLLKRLSSSSDAYAPADRQRSRIAFELGQIKYESQLTWNYEAIVKFICVGVVILAVIIVFLVSGGDSGGSKEQKNTCGVCGRTFSYTYDKENYKSVRNRNMCLNCYNNYKQGTQAVDDIRNNGV